jgi:hypothetical protein
VAGDLACVIARLRGGRELGDQLGMAAREAPDPGLRRPDIGCDPPRLRRRVGCPLRRRGHLLFDVVIHNRDVADLDDPRDRNPESLPLNS